MSNINAEDVVYFNKTKTNISISDTNPSVSIPKESYSRPFHIDEVKKSADLRRYESLGLLQRVKHESIKEVKVGEEEELKGDSPVLDVKGNGVTIDGGAVFSEGSENRMNPEFLPRDIVTVKGPSGLQGTLERFDKKLGRWEVKLTDGRTAWVREEQLVSHSDMVVADNNTQPRTIYASDVMKRNVVPGKVQAEARANTSTGRLNASEVIAGKRTAGTGAPSSAPSASQGRPASEGGHVPGKRFNADEIINRPPVVSGVEIVKDGARIIPDQPQVKQVANNPVTGEAVGSVSDSEDTVDDGGIIIAGQGVNDGSITSVSKIAESTLQEEARIARRKEKMAQRRKARKNKANEDTDEPKLKGKPGSEEEKWSSLRFSQKKMEISSTNDPERLQFILTIDKDHKITELVKQRMDQIIAENK